MKYYLSIAVLLSALIFLASPEQVQAMGGGVEQSASPGACDLERGQRVLTQCKACHSLEEGTPHLTGPNLHGIMGRVAGKIDGFRFSPSMRKSDIVWNDETLDTFLANPQKFFRGTRMAFGGVRNEADRAAVICLLGELK